MLVIGLGLYFLLPGGKAASAGGEVFLSSADSPGTATFTPSIAAPSPSSTVAKATDTPAPSPGGLTTSMGSSPGLYGGTRDVPSCDAARLVGFLEGDGERAKAWARAAGIATADIPAYVATLTPVLLRVDTRVTDFGFADGQPVARQVILEAATAVMIDRSGFPRVRCTSGNPLAEPRPVPRQPVYVGPRWPPFNPATVIVVAPSPSPLTLIVLVDVRTGLTFVRIPGSIVIIDIDVPPEGLVVDVVEPGQLLAVTGARWPAGTPLEVRFDVPPDLLATATADGAGNFAVDVTIPVAALPGLHQVTISGGGSAITQPVYVVPRAVTVRLTPL